MEAQHPQQHSDALWKTFAFMRSAHEGRQLVFARTAINRARRRKQVSYSQCFSTVRVVLSSRSNR